MKTSPKKPTPPASRRNWRKILLIILLLTVLAAIGIWYVLFQQAKAAQERAYQADKAKFAQVEADMSKVYTQLTTKLGTPDKQEMTKSCSHISLKFEKGDLWCGVYYRYGYTNQSKDDANKVEEYLQLALKDADVPISIDNRTEYDSGNGISTWNLIRKSTESCTIERRLGKASQATEFGIQNKLMTIFSFTCQSRMNRAIYTLAE